VDTDDHAGRARSNLCAAVRTIHEIRIEPAATQDISLLTDAAVGEYIEVCSLVDTGLNPIARP